MPTFYIEPSLSSYKNTGGLCGLKFMKENNFFHVLNQNIF